MHRYHSHNRLHMESLETRQLMAGDFYTAFQGVAVEQNMASTAVVSGDFTGDGAVTGRDFLKWQRSVGTNDPGADGNGDGIVDGADLTIWQQSFAPTVGGIRASVFNGSLFLEEMPGEEGLANGIKISRLANGNILVSGYDPIGGGVATSINGTSSVEFASINNLYIWMGDGDNSLEFDHSMSNKQLESVHIAGGSGNELIQIDGLKTSGDLSIGLLGGDDVVAIGYQHYGLVSVGDGNQWDAMYINTGAGVDQVLVSGGARIHGIVDVQTFEDVSETDFDEVTFDLNVYAIRDVAVRTGGGDDLVQFTNKLQEFQLASGLHTLGNLTVDTAAGNDTLYMRGVKTGGNLDVFAGAGADDVTADFKLLPDIFSGQDFLPRVGGNLTVQMYESLTDTDDDHVSLNNRPLVGGSIIAKFASGNDSFLLDNAEFIGNDLDLHMGDGDDTADISGFVIDHLMAWMGEGNDTLNLGKTWTYRLIADGDLGTDSLTTTPQTKSQYSDLFGWEFINSGMPTFDDQLWGDEGLYWQP